MKLLQPTPVLKWVGGKRQLLPSLLPLVPSDFTVYCEPFMGGGALLFALKPQRAIINDSNAELMNVYHVIKTQCAQLVEALKKHQNDPDYYYALRDLDRDKESFARMSDLDRASRTLYLNKTCYNGLYRVNAAGEFNAPYSRYKNPAIVNEDVLKRVAEYLNSAEIVMHTGNYSKLLNEIAKLGCEAFVYLDPPYDPISNTAAFTGYTSGGFMKEDQIALRSWCDKLDSRGVRFMLSNSATDFIKDLYSAYSISVVKAKRAINSNANGRAAIDEVVVRNYD